MQSGANLPLVRDYNQRVVLETIRRLKGASRSEIAQTTGLTLQTVSNIVKRLVEQSVILEAGKSASKGKKPSVKYRLNPEAGYTVGVQIERDELTFVVLDLDNRRVNYDSQPIPQQQAPRQVVDSIAVHTQHLVSAAGVDSGKILGLGAASPGPLDHVSGTVYGPPNFPGWDEVPLQTMLEETTGYTVKVDNNATASAIGERWASGTADAQNFAFLYIGVGIGTGLFIDGHVYRGSTTNAGELGHTTLDPNGPKCWCGNQGCVEVYCTPEAVTRRIEGRIRSGDYSTLSKAHMARGQLDFNDVRAAVIDQDRLCLEEIERSARFLGIAAADMTNLLDLELIVLGGGAVSGVGDIYSRCIEDALRDRPFARGLQDVRVELSHTGESAGAVGAASLILHSTYFPYMRGLRTLS